MAVATLELTFTDEPAFPVIVSASSATVTPGQHFSYTIMAPKSDTDDPAIFPIIGTLPPGLIFDAATGTISGIFQTRNSLLPGPDLSGGIVTSVQLVATNSHGIATLPLVFFVVPQGARNISTRLAVGTAATMSDCWIHYDRHGTQGRYCCGRLDLRLTLWCPGPAGTLRDPIPEVAR